MNKAAILLFPALASLSACGPKAISLPTDPIQSAATCGIVAAAQAREGQADIKAPLSLEAQGNILRHALAVGARSPEFAQDQASAIIKAMSDNADAVIEGDWKELIAPCVAAFPAPPATPALPADPYQAGLGCDALGRFMRAALASDGRYERTLADYNALERSLDTQLAPLLAKHGKTGTEAVQAEKRKAMTVFAKLGRPDQVMQACVARYS